MPYWGLAIVGTSVAFFVPLIYTTNQELIDHHIKNASEAINAQTAQVKSVAQKQADQISAMGKQYAGDYTGKVQDMLRGRSVSPTTSPKLATKQPEFPSPPTQEPEKTKLSGTSAPKAEPLIAV